MFACGVSSRKDNDDVQPEEKKEETGQKKVGYKESPVDWLKSSSAVNDIMFPLSTNTCVNYTTVKNQIFWIPGNGLPPILCGMAMPRRSSRPNFCVLYFHGNGEVVLESGKRRQYTADKFGALVIEMEYPGYPNCVGRGCATESTVCRDALTVADYITDTLQIPATKIMVYGRSIGSGVAMYVASKRQMGGLVLEAPFEGIRALAGAFAGKLGYFCAERFPNIKRIAKLQLPIAIVHGTLDEIIPFSHGESLAKAAGIFNSQENFLALRGYGHNNLPHDQVHRWLTQCSAFKATSQGSSLNTILIPQEHRQEPELLTKTLQTPPPPEKPIPTWKQLLRLTPEVSAAVAGIFSSSS
eukprot:m.79029 g.79029  ORF g.79029 m.79029 type:complete len:355 (-) comp12700_c0_seq1:2200-3264(-)